MAKKAKKQKVVKVQPEVKPTRNVLMLQAKERGIRNFRVLNKEESRRCWLMMSHRSGSMRLWLAQWRDGSPAGVRERRKMKVKAELDLKVEMGCVSHIGTGCQGYLPEGTRYEGIVRVFGKPQLGRSLDGKTKVEWVGRINGLVFTIYDYKSSLDPERNTDWHIGGKAKLTCDLVKVFFVANKEN